MEKKSSLGSLTKYGIKPDIGPYNPFSPGEPLEFLEPSGDKFGLSESVGVTVHRRQTTRSVEEIVDDITQRKRRTVPTHKPDEDEDRKPRPLPRLHIPDPDNPDVPDEPRRPAAWLGQNLEADQRALFNLRDWLHAELDRAELPHTTPIAKDKIPLVPTCEEMEEELQKQGLDIPLCPDASKPVNIVGDLLSDSKGKKS